MREHFSVALAFLLLGITLFGCGGSAPETETGQAPTAEAGPASEAEPPIHEDGFETGDESEWSESDPEASDEDDEPEIP